MKYVKILVAAISAALLFQSCSNKGPAGLFAKRTPSEKYADKLAEAGLKNSRLGQLWFAANTSSLNTATTIKLPYQEAGYFGAEKPAANGYFFSATQGERITIKLEQKPTTNFTLYADVYESDAGRQQGKLIGSLDSTTNTLSFDAERNPNYLLRLQPELLVSGEYTLTITNGASLAFPVQGKTKPQSFWGDGRDNNSRKHEGVDIFASKGTPALAAASGTVTRVGTNNLGGNVVFMRPEGKDYTLYYAHLDRQLVNDGQQVALGDTLGLVGNTGNAVTTTPHLHFGIYTFGGAIDPYPFINTTIRKPSPIAGSLQLLGDTLRTTQAVKVFSDPEKSATVLTLSKNTLLSISSAMASLYKITLPDNSPGYIDIKTTTRLSAINNMRLKADTPVLDNPDLNAPRKKMAKAGESISVLASFNNFNYIESGGVKGWVVR